MKVSVSYLRSKYSKKEMVRKLEHSSADLIHVDLMDGIFVPTKNFELEEVVDLLKDTSKPIDIHLMVQDPLLYLDSLLKLNPYAITIHVESFHVWESILKIQAHHVKAGLSFKPSTFLEELNPYFDQIDLILVMSVEPGAGGQPFMKRSIDVLQTLHTLQKDHSFLLSVDGGITDQTVVLVRDLVDIVVSGSYVCMADSLEESLENLRK